MRMQNLNNQLNRLRQDQLLPFALVSLIRLAKHPQAWTLFSKFLFNKAHNKADIKVEKDHLSITHSINGLNMTVSIMKVEAQNEIS